MADNLRQGDKFSYQEYEGFWLHYPFMVLTTNQSANETEEQFTVDNVEYMGTRIFTIPAMILSQYFDIPIPGIIASVKESIMSVEWKSNPLKREVVVTFQVGDKIRSLNLFDA